MRPKSPPQFEMPAVAETPVETYAREGKLMPGCLYGSKYKLDKNKKKILENGQPILLIKCGKLCEPGETSCPRCKLLEATKANRRPARVNG